MNFTYTFETERFFAAVNIPEQSEILLECGTVNSEKPDASQPSKLKIPTRSVTTLIANAKVADQAKERAFEMHLRYATYYESLSRHLIAAIAIYMALAELQQKPDVKQLSKMCEITLPTARRAKSLAIKTL